MRFRRLNSYLTVHSLEDLYSKCWHHQRVPDMTISMYYMITFPKKYPATLIGYDGEISARAEVITILISSWQYDDNL